MQAYVILFLIEGNIWWLKLTGFAYQMAESLCGRCVGGNGGVPVNEVLDNCGNCISETVECPCNG